MMTVRECRDLAERIPASNVPGWRNLLLDVPVWNNEACLGYAALALREYGMKGNDIRKVMAILNNVLGLTTVAKAEQVAWKLWP